MESSASWNIMKFCQKKVFPYIEWKERLIVCICNGKFEVVESELFALKYFDLIPSVSIGGRVHHVSMDAVDELSRANVSYK